jgi:Flp pilus assembly protein TadG
VTLEIAVLAPVLLLLVFSVVQAGLWAYARSLALAAAQEGAAAGAAYGAGAQDGVRRARQFATATAGDSLRDVDVGSAGSTATTVAVEVTGRSLSVLPGLPGIFIRQHAVAPRERFVPDLRR